MPDLLNDPEHWRESADQMRPLAEGATGANRESLLKVAGEYDKLAERAAKRGEG